MSENIGRPSALEQLKIEKTLRKYFERNYSATFTARITKINIKTVCKYFDEFAEQIREVENKTFLKRERIERDRIGLSLDNIIFEEYQLLDKIKKEIQKHDIEKKLVPRYLFRSQIEVLGNISALTQAKCSFALQMPLDESVQNMIEEKIRIANTRRDN